MRIAERRVQAGIRRADHDVRRDRVLQRQVRARALARLVHAGAVDDGVRAGKVDELKDAQAALLAAERGDGVEALFAGHDDLAGRDVPHDLGVEG